MKDFSRGASLLLFFTAVIIPFSMAGCCAGSDKSVCAKEEVIARINNYSLTASDFRDEAAPALSAERASADIEKAKEDALSDLVTKKVLLQEAQKENFDKDRKFMNEIERYWEQALLKLLMKKKIEEFSKKISPEIRGYIRQKMVQSELDRWVKGVRDSAKVTIYKEKLKNIEIK